MVKNSRGEVFPDKIRTKKEKTVGLTIHIMTSIAFACYAFKMIYDMVVTRMLIRDMILLSVFLLGVELLWISLTIAYYDCNWAKYEVVYHGLRVKYPFQSEKLIEWNEFQQVCICYGEVKTKGLHWAYVYICFVKKGQRKTPSGRWKHGAFNYRGVIPMNYTDALYNEVKAKCPLGIVDLRDTPEYAIK